MVPFSCQEVAPAFRLVRRGSELPVRPKLRGPFSVLGIAASRSETSPMAGRCTNHWSHDCSVCKGTGRLIPSRQANSKACQKGATWGLRLIAARHERDDVQNAGDSLC